MSEDLHKITRLHSAVRNRRQVIHVFSDYGYEMTVAKTFRDKRLKVGGFLNEEDREELKAAAKAWETGTAMRRAARLEKQAALRPSAGKITEISPGRQGGLLVFLDGRYAFSTTEEIIYQEGLMSGLELSEEQVGRLVSHQQVERVGQMIDRLTAVRLRAVSEIRKRLITDRKLDPDLVEAALAERKRGGLIREDADFIALFAKARGVRKGKDFWTLSGELRQLGLPAEAISAYKESYDVEGAAAVAIKKASRRFDVTNKVGRAKFIRYLQGKRFSNQLIFDYLRSIEIVDDELAEATDED
jgi:SOS response regulatory protein OraA/RecX